MELRNHFLFYLIKVHRIPSEHEILNRVLKVEIGDGSKEGTIQSCPTPCLVHMNQMGRKQGPNIAWYCSLVHILRLQITLAPTQRSTSVRKIKITVKTFFFLFIKPNFRVLNVGLFDV